MGRMKHLLMIVFATVSLAGCYGDDILDLENEVDRLEGRIEALEKIMAALENKDYVTSVTPLSDGTGYVISFQQSGDVTIRHGEDGTDGKDGDAWFSDIRIEGDYLILTLAGSGQTITVPFLSPGFGFAGLPDGPLTITVIDTLFVNLPAGYQTMTVNLEILEKGNSLMPAAVADGGNKPATRTVLYEDEKGEWEFAIQRDSIATQARIIVSAERPLYPDALLSVKLIDAKGETHELSKVIHRDLTSDYEYMSESDSYIVKSANGLMMINKILMSRVNDDVRENDGPDITLANDITLPGEYNWIPIENLTGLTGLTGMDYNGTFDGAGHKISEIYTYTGGRGAALFGAIDEGAVIKDLILSDCFIGSDVDVSGIAVLNYGTISGCSVQTSRIFYITTEEGTASAIASINYGLIEDCQVVSKNGYAYIDGVESVGCISARNFGVIDGCRVTGGNLDVSGYEEVGGIAGRNRGIITNCQVGSPFNRDIIIRGLYAVGGLVGSQYSGGVTMNCAAEGACIIYGAYNNYTTDNVYPTNAIGGLVGYNSGDIVGCLAHSFGVISPFVPAGMVGDQNSIGQLIGCYSYLGEWSEESYAGFTYYTDSQGFYGTNEGEILQCYTFLSDTGTSLLGVDTQDGPLAVIWEESAEYGDGALKKMNKAIEQYNAQEYVFDKCPGLWTGEMDKPSFKPINQ